MIRDPLLRALVTVMLLIAGVYFVNLLWQIGTQFADVILLFFLAWLLSFILEPIAGSLQRRLGLRRHLAVLLTYSAVVVFVSVLIVQFVPRLSDQIAQFVNDLPVYGEWINSTSSLVLLSLARYGIAFDVESVLTMQELLRHLEQAAPSVVSNTLGLATGVATLLAQAFITLILSYYIMLDGHRIIRLFLALLPDDRADDARFFLSSVNRAFAGFIRGQVAQALLYGLGTAAVMQVAGFKLVLLPSSISGALMLIPFVGPVLAMLVPLFLALVTKPEAFWGLLLSLFVLQQIIVNVVAPRLMSQAVGLHPLLVFLAVLGGVKVAGVWGALFGVPVLAVAAAMIQFYWAARERNVRIAPLAQGSPGPGAGVAQVGPTSPGASSESTAGAETPRVDVLAGSQR